MKQIFRAADYDNKRIIFVIADSLEEAIELVNEKEMEFANIDEDYFIHDESTVFPILPENVTESQIIDVFSVEYFV